MASAGVGPSLTQDDLTAMDSLTKGNTDRLLSQRQKWIKRFNIDDYIDNRPMIEKLYEERQLALCAVQELQERLETMTKEHQELRLENHGLRKELHQTTRQAASIFILSLVALVLLGLGVNVATAKPSEWLGWALIVAGIIVEFVAFWQKPPGKNND